MTPTIPTRRLQLTEVAPRQYGAMYRFSSSIELDHGLRLLIEIRASQINGCAFCLDMHWKDARAAGESEERLYMLSAWRESAALQRARARRAGAVRGDDRDRRRRRARRRLGAGRDGLRRDELGQVVFAVAVINTWNRLQITTQAEPGHYYPGMFDTPAAAGNGR